MDDSAEQDPQQRFASAGATTSALQSWFKTAKHQAAAAAAAAGQSIDRAADSFSSAVDHYANQANEAYEQRMARQLALAYQERDRHRAEQEASMSPTRQQRVLEVSEDLVSQCITLTGDVQSEIQYATKDSPLGRESYGLMMLVNVMVPVLEHGLRPDWRSILPAATVTSSSAQWLQNLAHKARSGQPTACDMLQAADSGWGHGEPHLLGINAIDLTRVAGEQRRTQAWLYDSLNHSVLAQRLQTLIALRRVLDDWYFPWALLRQEDRLTDFLTELVKVESQPGLVGLPMEQLHSNTSNESRANTTAWSQKMRDAFSELAVKANSAYGAASETIAKAARDAASPQAGTPTHSVARRRSADSELSQADELPDLTAQRAYEAAQRDRHGPQIHANDTFDTPSHVDDSGPGSAAAGGLAAADSFDRQAAFEIGIADGDDFDWADGLPDDGDGDAGADAAPAEPPAVADRLAEFRVQDGPPAELPDPAAERADAPRAPAPDHRRSVDDAPAAASEA